MSAEEPCVPVVLRGVWCESRVKVHVRHNLCYPKRRFWKEEQKMKWWFSMEISMANEIENSLPWKVLPSKSAFPLLFLLPKSFGWGIIVPQNEDFARPNQPFQTQIHSEFSHHFCEEGRSRKSSKSNVVGDDWGSIPNRMQWICEKDSL